LYLQALDADLIRLQMTMTDPTWPALYYSFDVDTVAGTQVSNVGNGGTSLDGELVNGAAISSVDSRIGTAALCST